MNFHRSSLRISAHICAIFLSTAMITTSLRLAAPACAPPAAVAAALGARA